MNTRFNPTANGRLHLGHLYVALLNYHAARSTGGRFTVRFDDDQPYWIERLGRPRIAEFCDAAREDLEWMGLSADLYSSQAQDRSANEALLIPLPPLQHIATDGVFITPEITSCARPYPYVPYLTAIKVVHDHREQIDCLIRGDDLVSEFSLYCHFCDRLGFPIPRFYYVPKLQHQGADLSDISKTAGQFKLADLRDAGETPQRLERLLRNSCLRDPDGAWEYENVLLQPVLRV